MPAGAEKDLNTQGCSKKRLMVAGYYINDGGRPVSEDGSDGYGHNGLEISSNGPCLVYVKVGGVLYLDPEQSKKDSPRSITEEMILEESRKAHGELPLLGGLERRIVEEKRRNAGELWARGKPKERHEQSLSSISAFP